MLDFTTAVGLDVHARSIKAVAFNVVTGEVAASTFGYDAAAVSEWIGSLEQPARAVYESGVTGFDLAKRLEELGIDCIVGAVSKMIKPPADRRRKTDRNDAEFLARMLAAGNVSPVWVPDDDCEAARDLSRALEDARDELLRSKQLLSKFLLRHGYVFDKRNPAGTRVKNWTRAHWEWMRSIRFGETADADVMLYYMDRVERAAAEKKRLEELVAREADQPRWKAKVDALRQLKGIEVATAFALACEAGEFSRFCNARAFSAWARPRSLAAFERREERQRAHHQGWQPTPQTAARRGLVALPQRLLARQGEGRRLHRARRGQEARAKGSEAPAGQEGRDGREEDERQQGKRRHRARAFVLGLGHRVHGGGCLGQIPGTYRHPSRRRMTSRPSGKTPPSFYATAHARHPRLKNGSSKGRPRP